MKYLFIIILVFLSACVQAPGKQWQSTNQRTLENSDYFQEGPSFGERMSRALGAAAEGFKNASQDNGGKCYTYAPYPPYGCTMVCIDGRWQSVCQ